MSTTLKPLFSTETTITCGFDALANSATAARQSLVIDNTTNLYEDALVSCQVKTVAGSLAAVPFIDIYAYGWSYGQASDYTDNAAGTDSAFTLPTTLSPNLKFVGRITYNVAANTTLYCGPFSVAAAFGGTLPGKWGVIVNNQTGLALAGSANGQVSNTLSFVGVNRQAV